MINIENSSFSFFSGVRSSKLNLAIFLMSRRHLYCINLHSGSLNWNISNTPEMPIGLSEGIFICLTGGGFTFRNVPDGSLVRQVPFSNVPEVFLEQIRSGPANWMFQHLGEHSVLCGKWKESFDVGIVQIQQNNDEISEPSCILFNHRTEEIKLQTGALGGLEANSRVPTELFHEIRPQKEQGRTEINREYVDGAIYTTEAEGGALLSLCKYSESLSEPEWVLPLVGSKLLKTEPNIPL